MLKAVRYCKDVVRSDPLLLDAVNGGWANYAQMAFATNNFEAVAVALQYGASKIPPALQVEFAAFQRQYNVGKSPYLLIYDFPKTRPSFMISNQVKKLPFFPDEAGGGWYHLLEEDVIWAETYSSHCDTIVTASRQTSGAIWVVDIHLPIIGGELVKDPCYRAFMVGRELSGMV